MHSTEHHSARDHIGKKVVIIGACTSGRPIETILELFTLTFVLPAHDIAADYVEHGVGEQKDRRPRIFC